MKLPTLFKQQRNRTFGYTPRYYDERKERRDKLAKKIKTPTINLKNEKGGYRKSWKYVKKNKDISNQKLRTFVILLFLLILIWVIFKQL